MRSMKFGNREVLCLLVMIGLLAASYYFGFARLNERRHEKQDQIAEKLKALADTEVATAYPKTVQDRINEQQKATAFFESKLPAAKELDTVLKEIWQLAEGNNLANRTVRMLPAQRLAGYSEQPIEMSLGGDFNGFYEFLLKMEKLPRLKRVTSMNLTKMSDHDGEMQAQLSMSVYFAPDTGGGNGPAGK